MCVCVCVLCCSAVSVETSFFGDAGAVCEEVVCRLAFPGDGFDHLLTCAKRGRVYSLSRRCFLGGYSFGKRSDRELGCPAEDSAEHGADVGELRTGHRFVAPPALKRGVN